jgi:hypothetical protein
LASALLLSVVNMTVAQQTGQARFSRTGGYTDVDVAFDGKTVPMETRR